MDEDRISLEDSDEEQKRTADYQRRENRKSKLRSAMLVVAADDWLREAGGGGIDDEILAMMNTPDDMDPTEWEEAKIIPAELKQYDYTEYWSRRLLPGAESPVDLPPHIPTTGPLASLAKETDVPKDMPTSTTLAMEILKNHSSKTDKKTNDPFSSSNKEAVDCERPHISNAGPLKSCLSSPTMAKSPQGKKAVSFGRIDVKMYFITEEEKDWKMVDCRNDFVECNGRKLRDMSSAEYGMEELDNLDIFLDRKLKYKKIEDARLRTKYDDCDHLQDRQDVKRNTPVAAKSRKATVVTCDVINRMFKEDLANTENMEDIGLSRKWYSKHEESDKPEYDSQRDKNRDTQGHPLMLRGAYQPSVACAKTMTPKNSQGPRKGLSTTVPKVASDTTLPIRDKSDVAGYSSDDTLAKRAQAATERMRRRKKLANNATGGGPTVSKSGENYRVVSINNPVSVAWGEGSGAGQDKLKRRRSNETNLIQSSNRLENGHFVGENLKHDKKCHRQRQEPSEILESRAPPSSCSSSVTEEHRPSKKTKQRKARTDESVDIDIKTVKTSGCSDIISKVGVRVINVRSKTEDEGVEWDNTGELEPPPSTGENKMEERIEQKPVNTPKDSGKSTRTLLKSKELSEEPDQSPPPRILMVKSADHQSSDNTTNPDVKEHQESPHLESTDDSSMCPNVASSTDQGKVSRCVEENLPLLYSNPDKNYFQPSMPTNDCDRYTVTPTSSTTTRGPDTLSGRREPTRSAWSEGRDSRFCRSSADRPLAYEHKRPAFQQDSEVSQDEFE